MSVSTWGFAAFWGGGNLPIKKRPLLPERREDAYNERGTRKNKILRNNHLGNFEGLERLASSAKKRKEKRGRMTLSRNQPVPKKKQAPGGKCFPLTVREKKGGCFYNGAKRKGALGVGQKKKP